MVAIAQQQIPKEQQQDRPHILQAMFGTPDDPFVLPDAGLDLAKIQQAAGPVRSDQFGHETGVYRRHCGHCHGTTGDGLGPTAMLLNPYPRYYRQGKFKFKSTERPAKPTEYDLEAPLRRGVPGTAMPSFDLLPDCAGQGAGRVCEVSEHPGRDGILPDRRHGRFECRRSCSLSGAVVVDEILKPVVETWTTASASIIRPEDKPDIKLADSVDQGRELFYSTKANCVKCHGPASLGDGQASDYDDWSKPVAEMAKSITDERNRLKTETDIPAADAAPRCPGWRSTAR